MSDHDGLRRLYREFPPMLTEKEVMDRCVHLLKFFGPDISREAYRRYFVLANRRTDSDQPPKEE